jgi:hypothetical protein
MPGVESKAQNAVIDSDREHLQRHAPYVRQALLNWVAAHWWCVNFPFLFQEKVFFELASTPFPLFHAVTHYE